MGEDDLVELLWKSDQVVRSSQAQTHSSDPPPILRGSGSGSGGGEINDPLPLPQPPSHDQNLFIQEDEMASWLHHPLSQDYFSSELLYSSAPATHHPQSSVSLPPPPTGAPYGSMFAARRTENFMNFSRLIGNIHNTGVRVEAAGPSTQVGSSATPSSSAIESCVIPATENRATATGGVSRTFAVPGLGRKEKAVAIETVHEIGGTSSSGVCKAETEPFQVQLTTETGIADDRKRKEREETMAEIKETEEAGGSTCRKRSRAAEMHNISERRRRERINEKMKALQELIPRCNKSDKASMLDDAIEYMKSLQMQIQPASPQIHLADDDVDGHGMMPPMMYAGNMQQFMPHMAMGMMGMNRPPFIPRPAHMVGRGPSYSAPRFPLPNVQTSDPSRVHLPNPQSNQPQFPAYMNPYSQFVGLHQMHQPPPLPSQTTSQMSFSQASSSKEPGDHDNQPAGLMCRVKEDQFSKHITVLKVASEANL